jgi:uncharacterized membrane protein
VSTPTTDDDVRHLEVELIAAERLTFFSDAVVAIAITLLALELPVPRGNSNREFLQAVNDEKQVYIAFLISFSVIGAHWFGHHRMFRYVTGLSRGVTRWNMLWLLMIILTPFTTRVLIADGAFEARFTCYATVQALAGLFFLLAVRDLSRQGLLRPETPPDTVRNTYWRLGIFVAAFTVSIPIAFVTSWAYACWVAMPFVTRLARRLTARRLTATG